MSDSFRESNTKFFRDTVTFNKSFGVIQDAAWNVGTTITTGSFLNTYQQIRPYGGISGYVSSGNLSRLAILTTGNQTISGVKTFTDIMKATEIKSPTTDSSIDLNQGTLYNGLNQSNSLDWINNYLFDTAGNISLDWENKIANDSAGTATINWESKQLFGEWNLSGTINGIKKYVAFMSQAGTAAPVPTIVENSLGAISWSRINNGYYSGNLTNAFPSKKTIVEGYTWADGTWPFIIWGQRVDNNSILLYSLSMEFNGYIDNALVDEMAITISVYP